MALRQMISWKLGWKILFGKPEHPEIPKLRLSGDDHLYFDSLTRGTVVSGDPGTGKTTWTADELVHIAVTHPDIPIVIFDASGSLSDEFIEIVHTLPREQFDQIYRRCFFDIPGKENDCIAKPLFAPESGLTSEEQVQKAAIIVQELNSEKLAHTPMMAASLTATAPQIFRLVQAFKDSAGRSWQITEVKRVLMENHRTGLMHKIINRVGGQVPEAKWYLENQFLREDVTATSLEAHRTALVDALGIIESRPLRARYGYPVPGITMKEVVDRGLIYIINGSELTNQKDAQAWVFWDAYLELKSLINRRTPHDPADKPVLVVMDEIYQLFKIPGMAEEIGQISAYYRSRKLCLMMIIQAHWQLSDKLLEQVWNMGNHVSFSMENQNDAYRLAQQIFPYDPHTVKLPAVHDTGQPVMEPDRGQYLKAANWIQNLPHRAMIMRRYINEQTKEGFVAYVKRTRDKPYSRLTKSDLELIKMELMAKRAVPVDTALKMVNSRVDDSFKPASKDGRPQL